MADKIQEIMNMPEFDLQNFSVIDLECQVLRKYYIELSSVLFIEDIARYFLSELVIDSDEFEQISDAFSHKDKANVMLGIIHQKIKSGDKKVFKMTLDSLSFYGIDKVQAVAEKMRRKLFEMRINRRSEIKQRMNNRIQGREERNYYYNDDDPVEVPEFPGYKTILRCNVKLKTTMTRILRKADFPVIREACYKHARTDRGPWLSKHFIESIKLVETVEELFDVLLHNQQWDWINFQVLESIVDSSKMDIARKVLDAYKDYMLHLTLTSVFNINSMVVPIDKPGVEYTKVKEVLAADVKHMMVGELLEHKTFLERHVFDINEGSTRVAFIDSRSWEVVWIIPAECSYHAYRRACSNVSKFSSVVSLEIEDYPVIKQLVEHSIDLPNVAHASSVEIIDQYSSVLLEQLNAMSITDTMVSRGLLTETDREVINTAANEYQKNYYILERVQNMDNYQLLLFCDVLQGVGNQKNIGGTLMSKLSTVKAKRDHSVDALPSSYDKETVSTPRRNSLGKRPPTHGDSPCTKRTKVLEASRRFSSVVTEICKALESTKCQSIVNCLNQLMASEEPKIPLFTSEIVESIADCENAGILVKRMSLYFSWFDHEILKKLVGASNCVQAIQLLHDFDSQLDYSLPLSSQSLPIPSPNMIPNDTHPSTLLTTTTTTTKEQSQYSLRYIDEFRSWFSSLCKISQYSLHLVAVKQAHATSLIFYWMLPKSIVPLICCKVQESCQIMRSKGVIEVAVYPGVVIATDSEVRLGPLAFLTIKDGSCHADAKLSLSRVKEVPDIITKLFSELDEYRKQEEKKSEVELQMQSETTKNDQHLMDTDSQESDGLKSIEAEDDTSEKEKEDTYLIDLWLSKNLPYYCHQLEQRVPSIWCLDQITAASWESREASLKQLTRNLALLLVPSFTDEIERRPSDWKLSRSNNIKSILEACCAIVAYGCTDPVFAVYQAALNLCWVLAFITLCSSATELDNLQVMFRPIFSAVFSRYHDPQENVRECTKQFLRLFIHTQVGVLSTINNLPTTFRLGGVECILMSTLAPPVHRSTSEQWWLGRLHFLQDAFTTKYSHYFFPRDKPQELHYYSSYRRSQKYKVMPIPVSREESLKLFTLLWKFVSDATRSQYDVVVDLAVQIYCDSVDLVLDYSDGLIRAREFINSCRQSVVGKIKKLITKAQDRVVQLEKEAAEAAVAAAAAAAAEKERKEREAKEKAKLRRGYQDDGSDTETKTKEEKAKEEKAKEEKPIEEPQDDQPTTPKEPEPSDDTARVGTLFKQVAQFVPVEILKHEELLGQLLMDSDLSEVFPKDLWGGKELSQDKAAVLADYQAEYQAAIIKHSYPPIFLPAPTNDMLAYVQGGDESSNTVMYREGMEWIKGNLVCADNVYSAQDVRTGTIMAVKQVSCSADNKEEKEESLLKELTLMVGLDHSNVVHFIGATHELMNFNIFMEWTAGGSLQQLLCNSKGLHPLVVASYTRQVVQGVAYLHSLRILHRNLCDATLLVDFTGQRVKVSDLSCAVKMNDSEIAERVQFSDDYKIRHALYTAPEMLRREPYGLSSDVWSIGCCAIKMATGRPPWNLSKADDPYAEAINIAMATSAPIIPGNLTVEATDLVIRCLELKPEDRPMLSDMLEHAVFKHDSMP